MRNVLQSVIVALVCVVAIPPIVGAAISARTADPGVTALKAQVRLLNARVTSTQDRVRALTTQLKSKATVSALTQVKATADAAAASAASAGNVATGARASSDAGIATLAGQIAAIPRGPKAYAEIDNAAIGATTGNVSARRIALGVYCVSVTGLNPRQYPATVSLLLYQSAPTGLTIYSGAYSSCNPNEYYVAIYSDINTPVTHDGAFSFLVP